MVRIPRGHDVGINLAVHEEEDPGKLGGSRRKTAERGAPRKGGKAEGASDKDQGKSAGGTEREEIQERPRCKVHINNNAMSRTERRQVRKKGIEKKKSRDGRTTGGP